MIGNIAAGLIEIDYKVKQAETWCVLKQVDPLVLQAKLQGILPYFTK